jgi:hypothetical protein
MPVFISIPERPTFLSQDCQGLSKGEARRENCFLPGKEYIPYELGWLKVAAAGRDRVVMNNG